jgi:hypothetical protein
MLKLLLLWTGASSLKWYILPVLLLMADRFVLRPDDAKYRGKNKMLT